MLNWYIYQMQVAGAICAYVAALFSMVGLHHVSTGQVKWQLFEDIHISRVRGAPIEYQHN